MASRFAALRGWLLLAGVLGGGYAFLHFVVLRPEPVPVRVATVQRGVVASIVSNTKAGSVRARRRATLSTEGAGVIVAMPRREGATVQAGDVVLQLTLVTGRDAAALVPLRRHKIGFIFQRFHLVGRMTAVRNVQLPLVFAGVAPAEQQRRAVSALEQVGLAHRLEHRPDELSGGEVQRVAIARALVMDPPVLLADEPTGNLDSTSGAEIIALLHDLHRRGRTVVMVTHDDELAHTGSPLVRLRDGVIAESHGP